MLVAQRLDRLDMFNLLLDLGANPNIISEQRATALFYACYKVGEIREILSLYGITYHIWKYA